MSPGKGTKACVIQPSKKFCLDCGLDMGVEVGMGEENIPDRRDSMCEDLGGEGARLFQGLYGLWSG